jgi:hypothetical protein
MPRWDGYSGGGRSARHQGKAWWRRIPIAPTALVAVGAGALVLVFALAAVVMLLPSYLRNRQQVQEQAVASATPLVAPDAIDGLPRNRSREMSEVDAQVTRSLRDRGYDNTAVGNYGNGTEGLLISLVRTPVSTDRQRFVRYELNDQQSRHDGLRLEEVTRGGLILDCAALPAGGSPLRSFCLWNDGDTAGAAFGYEMGTDRLATLAASGRAAMTGSGQKRP